MGFYIEVEHNLNKAGQLIKLGAEDVGLPPKKFADIPTDKMLICVVQNGPFDAAGIIYSEDEFEAFKETRTGRPRTWLYMTKEKLCELKPVLAEYIRGEKSWRSF